MEGLGNNPRYPYKPVIPLTYFINPEIEVLNPEQMELYEGCLSVPGFRGKVKRHAQVRVTAKDRKGSTFRMICSGHAAGTMQHEKDHLDATLFPDLVEKGDLLTSKAFEQFYSGNPTSSFLKNMEAINEKWNVPVLFE